MTSHNTERNEDDESAEDYAESLMRKMNTKESIEAVDRLFDMTGEELGAAHSAQTPLHDSAKN